MSVADKGKIDAVALSEDGTEIVFLISDHLKWKDEYGHLMLLQDKINAYISYWEDRQYDDIYRDNIIDHGMIEIHFKYSPSKRCKEFLEAAQEQIIKTNLYIRYYVD